MHRWVVSVCAAALLQVLGVEGTYGGYRPAAGDSVARRVPVSTKCDDAEVLVPGRRFNDHSTDLELGYNKHEQLVAVRFRDARIPQGAVVEEAYITFTAEATEGGESPSLLLRGEATDSSERFSSRTSPYGRRETQATVAWNNLGVWRKGETYRTPDLSAVVGEVAGRSGWSSKSALTLFVIREGNGKCRRSAWAYDGSKSQAPVLVVRYREGGSQYVPPPPPPPPAVRPSDVVERRVRISTEGDDVEVRERDGQYKDRSGDLDLAYDKCDQLVALLFRGARVPQGAVIEEAYVVFTADESERGESPSLIIHGDAADSSERFSKQASPLGRPETAAGVEWGNLGAWRKGETYRTPDLSAVVGDITSRPGYGASSAVSLMIRTRVRNNKARRNAVSYDGSKSDAPVLVVRFRERLYPSVGIPSVQPRDLRASSPPSPCACGALRPGLRGIFWRSPMTSHLQRLPQMAPGSPLRESSRGRVERLVRTLDEQDTGHAWAGLPASFTQQFADVHVGFLSVAAPGAYRVHVTSNDGSRVLIDGRVVVDNDRNHRMQTRSSQQLQLSVGAHALEVQHFQGRGTAGLRLEWTKPDGTREVVPADSLGLCNCGTR